MEAEGLSSCPPLTPVLIQVSPVHALCPSSWRSILIFSNLRLGLPVGYHWLKKIKWPVFTKVDTVYCQMNLVYIITTTVLFTAPLLCISAFHNLIRGEVSVVPRFSTLYKGCTKSQVFWDVVLWRCANSGPRFEGLQCPSRAEPSSPINCLTLTIRALRHCETSVTTRPATQRRVLEGFNHQQHCWKTSNLAKTYAFSKSVYNHSFKIICSSNCAEDDFCSKSRLLC
jgi:hypothetical protein